MSSATCEISEENINDYIVLMLNGIRHHLERDTFDLQVKKNFFGNFGGPDKKRYAQIKMQFERGIGSAWIGLTQHGDTTGLVHFFANVEEFYERRGYPPPDHYQVFKNFLFDVGVLKEGWLEQHRELMREIAAAKDA